MLTQLPPWPASMPRRFTPRAKLVLPEGPRDVRSLLDQASMRQAQRTLDRAHAIRCSALTGTWAETIFVNRADHSAVASFTSEASLLSGTNQQPVFPALFFNGRQGVGRSVRIIGKGVLSSTSTPTYTFSFRLGTTAGSSYLSGTAVGVTAAITTASSITNKYFEFQLDLTCYTPGIGSGNTTLSGAGYIMSPGGFASPFIYPIEPTTPDTATWTATIDAASTQYLNCSVACSASSASNTITLKQLLVLGLN